MAANNIYRLSPPGSYRKYTHTIPFKVTIQGRYGFVREGLVAETFRAPNGGRITRHDIRISSERGSSVNWSANSTYIVANGRVKTQRGGQSGTIQGTVTLTYFLPREVPPARTGSTPNAPPSLPTAYYAPEYTAPNGVRYAGFRAQRYANGSGANWVLRGTRDASPTTWREFSRGRDFVIIQHSGYDVDLKLGKNQVYTVKNGRSTPSQRGSFR